MLATRVCALTQLRQSDSLPLSLTDQIPLELSEGTHDAQEQMRHRGVLTSEGEVFFLKADVDAALCESEHYLSQIVQIAGQPIHRMTNHCVAFPDVTGELFELRPVEVLA